MKPNVIAGLIFGILMLVGVCMAINSPSDAVATPTVTPAVIEQTDVGSAPILLPIVNVSDCANGKCAITRERTVERKATVQRAAPVAKKKPLRRLLGRLRRR